MYQHCPKITATVESSNSIEENNDETLEVFIASLDRRLTQAFGLSEKQDTGKSALTDLPSFCRHTSTPAVPATGPEKRFKRSLVNKRLINAVHARKYDDTIYYTTHSGK